VSDQMYPVITLDGAGGAIVTWIDYRAGIDIYAQRVDASGGVRWTANGVPLCTAGGNQTSPVIAPDGVGGAIVTWSDYRAGTDIYTQSVNARGVAGCHVPDILHVRDVPHDQGGEVRIEIARSVLDVAQETTYPVLTYNVWQRVDDPATLALLAQEKCDGASSAAAHEMPPRDGADASWIAGWPIDELDGRYFVQSDGLLGAGTFPSGAWELVGSFAACQQIQYMYRARTLVDSTGSEIPYSVYFVSAHTTTPTIWFASDPDSGYSVDNIPPELPAGLAAEQSFSPIGLAVSWSVNAANDFSHFVVHRGMSAEFVPDPGNQVATPTVPRWFDGSWRWDGNYYYKVAAVDIHGNVSGHALLSPDAVTGVETPVAPATTYLDQNFPNPFNPTTRIVFGLAAPANVSLRIYDAAGRLVRMLVEGARPAGNYSELWDGRDANGRAVASGIYFYRLQAGAFTETRKMALLR
jgi:hypothetical protein